MDKNYVYAIDKAGCFVLFEFFEYCINIKMYNIWYSS